MIELESPQIEPVEELGTYAKYEAGPLPAGYGVTLGNALRRVLLSSLEGAAVTSIQIRDVYQEFSTIPGVKEDVTQIVLNVKKLRLKSFAATSGPAQAGQERRRRGDRRRHRRVGRRRDRQPRADPDDPRHGRRDDRDGPDRRARRRLPRRRAVRGAADRRHRGRRDLHAGPQGQLLGREHPRRPDHQLRQADHRDRDRRHDHPGGGALALREILVRQFQLFVTIGMAATPRRRRRRGAGSCPRTCSTCRSRSSTCRCGPTTRSSATTSSRSASSCSCQDDDLLRMRNFGKKSLDEMKERLRMRGFVIPESEPRRG
jgi:hypothetical protein